MEVDHFNLRSFDLNLLLAFDALFFERSVTRAAARLRIKQPAMSHALSALRLLLQDELFTRSASGLEPSHRAITLAPGVRRLLEQAQTTLFGLEPFKPETSAATFRIGMSDQLEVVLLPRLIEQIRREAPQVKLLVRTADRDRVHTLLEAGQIDLAVGFFPPAGKSFRTLSLFEETHVCVFNPRRVRASLPITRTQWLSLPHALVSSKDRVDGYMEDAFRKAGVRPNVVMATPRFMTIAFVLHEAEMIATLPSKIAKLCADTLNLAISPLPVRFPAFPVEMVWHARSEQDPASLWLRKHMGALGQNEKNRSMRVGGRSS